MKKSIMLIVVLLILWAVVAAGLVAGFIWTVVSVLRAMGVIG